MTLQIICIPPKEITNLSEVQRLVMTVREQKRLDIEVEYLSYGTIYGVNDYEDLKNEVINLPLPHGTGMAAFQLRTTEDEWHIYEFNQNNGVLVRKINCKYRNIPQE